MFILLLILPMFYLKWVSDLVFGHQKNHQSQGKNTGYDGKENVELTIL